MIPPEYALYGTPADLILLLDYTQDQIDGTVNRNIVGKTDVDHWWTSPHGRWNRRLRERAAGRRRSYWIGGAGFVAIQTPVLYGPDIVFSIGKNPKARSFENDSLWRIEEASMAGDMETSRNITVWKNKSPLSYYYMLARHSPSTVVE